MTKNRSLFTLANSGTGAQANHSVPSRAWLGGMAAYAVLLAIYPFVMFFVPIWISAMVIFFAFVFLSIVMAWIVAGKRIDYNAGYLPRRLANATRYLWTNVIWRGEGTYSTIIDYVNKLGRWRFFLPAIFKPLRLYFPWSLLWPGEYQEYETTESAFAKLLWLAWILIIMFLIAFVVNRLIVNLATIL